MGNGSAAQGMTIYTSSATAGNIFFAKGTAGSEPYRGFIQYGQSGLTSAPDSMLFGTASTERMRIDASGNLGISVIPANWYVSRKSLSIYNGASFTGVSDGGAEIWANAYLNAAGDSIYVSTNAAALYQINRGGAGIHAWFNAPSGTAGNAITFTQAMTLDSSGNLVIGSTSTGGRRFNVSSTINQIASLATTATGAYSATTYNGSDCGRLIIQGGGASGSGNGIVFTQGASSELWFGQVQEAGGAGAFVWQGYNGSAYAERARITSSGTLCVNTSNPAPGSGAIQVAPKNDVGFGADNASAYYSVANYYSGSFAGGLYVTTGATALITSSDYRLKNTIAPMTGALAKVAQLKPVTYKWNADGSDGEGFIAHELAQVFPKAVLGEKDDVDSNGDPKYQGVDKLFLVATLTAAIQEQQALIESLTTRLAALEAA